MKKNIITFINMKGGVCKTTLCVNIANVLAQLGKRVLVIDLDPQFNATQYVLGVLNKGKGMDEYKKYKSDRRTIFEIFKKEIEDINGNSNDSAFTYNSNSSNTLDIKNLIIKIKPNLNFILGDIELIKMEFNQIRGTENVLYEYIENNELKELYDYILIDSPPTYSFFFRSALIAADTYISPVNPDYLASLGLSLMIQAIKQTQKLRQRDRREINSLGIVYTLLNSTSNIHEPLIEDIEKTLKKNSNKINNLRLRELESIPFKERIYRYTSVQRGVKDGNFMYDITDQNISKTIKFITEEFIHRMEVLNYEEK